MISANIIMRKAFQSSFGVVEHGQVAGAWRAETLRDSEQGLQLVRDVRASHQRAVMGHSEAERWGGLAEAHALLPVDIELLMSCKVVQSKLQAAYEGEDTEQITKLLGSLVRAVVSPELSTTPLEDVTLRIALRHEDHVSLPMASCVRLARLLACKLDALGGLSYIYDV